MEYQRLLIAYDRKDLDVSDLKKKLEISKSLVGRERFRVLDMNNNSTSFAIDTKNLLNVQEKIENVNYFKDEIRNLLETSFMALVNEIKKCKAWKVMGLISFNFSLKNFQLLSQKEKFRTVLRLNDRYYKFLEIQKIVDVKNTYTYKKELTDDDLLKIQFIIKMFNNIENINVKREFFCLSKPFLNALKGFKKSKIKRLEDYMLSKNERIKRDYIEKYSPFFTTEDFRDIIDNLIVTSVKTKILFNKIIDIYYELSETEAEKWYLKEEYVIIEELEKKYKRMLDLSKEKSEDEEDDANNENESQMFDSTENSDFDNVLRMAKKKISKYRTMKIKSKKKEIKKEKVIPVIISWFDRDEITITKKLSAKVLSDFFNKLRLISLKQNKKISIYLITNTDKKVTLDRITDIKKKIVNLGYDFVFESALGGYASFRISPNGEIKDISQISDVNKEKIKLLLDSTKDVFLPRNSINTSVEDYLRYEISDGKTNRINFQYLNSIIEKLLLNSNIKKQPIRFLPYIEKNSAGIDVLLESQIKGISQIVDYYNYKYDVDDTQFLKINLDKIEDFLYKI